MFIFYVNEKNYTSFNKIDGSFKSEYADIDGKTADKLRKLADKGGLEVDV